MTRQITKTALLATLAARIWFHPGGDSRLAPSAFPPGMTRVRALSEKAPRGAELAKAMAAEAAQRESQRETLADARSEVRGNAALCSSTWRLYHNATESRKGRAFFSPVKKDGGWRIAALVRHRD
jgi:hypothetical protein